MKLTRFAAIALSASALAAISVPFAAHAATTHATAQVTEASAAPSVAAYDCANQPQVRPVTFFQFCDGSAYVDHLQWSTWNASTATGTGTQYVDNCTPNCASGKWSHRTVDLIFWRSIPVQGHPGERGYTQMTELYPGARVGSNNTYTSAPPGLFPGEF
jgi:hypothetical protein